MTPSSYAIRLENIRFRAKHGVSDSERDLPQDFLVTLEVWLPVSVLPSHDRMQDVFDYDRLASIVVAEGTGTPYKLLERFAARLLERLFADTPATRARVSVTKLRPPTESSVDSVIVTLESDGLGPAQQEKKSRKPTPLAPSGGLVPALLSLQE